MVTMLGTPHEYPKYIQEIKDPAEKLKWQEKYIIAYNKEYNKYDQEWDGLKAAMYGVSILAVGTFACIMMGTLPASIPLIVASIIATSAIGITAAVCTMIYYGFKSGQNADNIKSMYSKFPIQFETEFRKQELERILAEQRSQLFLQYPPVAPPPSYPGYPTQALYPQGNKG